jgi:hypothetical protein
LVKTHASDNGWSGRSVQFVHNGACERADRCGALLTAAFIGVVLGRHAGTFEHLAKATTAELLALLLDRSAPSDNERTVPTDPEGWASTF